MTAENVRRKISSAIDLIVHQERCDDGQRRITQVVEVSGMERDNILLQDIFSLKAERIASQVGRYKYFHVPTVMVPTILVEKLRRNGVDVDLDWFKLTR